MSDAERIRISEYLTQSIHIDSRPVDPQLYHGEKQGEPRRFVWVRTLENIGRYRYALCLFENLTLSTYEIKEMHKFLSP